ncbi:FecR domain-containing protein [Verrucomicrobium sp. BvORR034]|uniref:FecR family protein n=1 Tax=Verrucomicrobium sp. BvORR034 TaxID=1396418 RepID=UPI0009DFFABF|nr:FecR domain-containing protein [Verrucomicrobium sp. BvORR034]
MRLCIKDESFMQESGETNPTTPGHSPIAVQAVEWLMLRLDGGSWTSAEETAFQAWCKESPEHEREYREAETAYKLMSMPESLAEMQAEAIVNRSGGQVRRGMSKRRSWLAATAMTAALVVAGGYYLHQRDLYSTGVGEIREWVLSDGTRITLDAQSKVRCRITEASRKLAVESGGAIFKVGKDARPFEVTAGNVLVRDIGTTFDVHKRALDPHGAMDEEIEVSVAEGLVELTALTGPPAVPVRIAAGQQLVWLPDGRATEPSQIMPGVFGSWRQGRLIYRDRPLSQVVADLRRYHRREITLEDQGLADYKIRGTIQIHDLDRALEMLSRATPVKIVHASSNKIVIGRKQP